MFCPMCNREMAKEEIIAEINGQDSVVEAMKCFFCGEEMLPKGVSAKFRVI